MVVADDDHPGWVEHLADPARAKRAFWHLVRSGPDALPAVRAGAAHPDCAVRVYCTRALDHLTDGEAFADLIRLLDDPHPRVRAAALHALACDRCKATTCRPPRAEVLGPAMRLLAHDTNGAVRCMAVEVVSRYAGDDPDAVALLVATRDRDASPTVRKKAGWHAPGGPIWRRTAGARRP
jgi:hypothetical protein